MVEENRTIQSSQKQSVALLGSAFYFNRSVLNNNIIKKTTTSKTVPVVPVIDLTSGTNENEHSSSSVGSSSDRFNDSVEIVLDNRKHSPKMLKRKRSNDLKDGSFGSKNGDLDDSIEICYETSGRKNSGKIFKTRNISATSTSTDVTCTVTSTTDVICMDSKEESPDIIMLDTESEQRTMKDKDTFLPSIKRNVRFSNYFLRDNVLQNASAVRQFSPNIRIPNIIVDTEGSKDNQGCLNNNRQQQYKSPLSSLRHDKSGGGSYHNIYGDNMYNPNCVSKTGLRPVIIDGSNVAFGHGRTSFSTRGLIICIQYFLNRGHTVIAFVPLFRRNEVTNEERALLDSFQKKGQLVFTPSRYLNGRCVVPYDDRYIVQCAAELGGVIVSTDNFRDLINENSAWRETIEKRLLMFTWVGDLLMFPDDPNGRAGPRLEEFLRFPN